MDNKFTDEHGREFRGREAADKKHYSDARDSSAELAGLMENNLGKIWAVIFFGILIAIPFFAWRIPLREWGKWITTSNVFGAIFITSIAAAVIFIFTPVLGFLFKTKARTALTILTVIFFGYIFPIGYNTLGNELWKMSFFDGRDATVNVSELALRAEPAQNSRTGRVLQQNETVQIRGATDSGWLFVVASGREPDRWGWVDSENLKFDSSKRLKMYQPARILSENLFVHRYPRPQSMARNFILKGDKVFATGKPIWGWTPVYRIDKEGFGSQGYVFTNQLFIDDGSGAQPPAAPPVPPGRIVTVSNDTVIVDWFTMRSNYSTNTAEKMHIADTASNGRPLKRGDKIIAIAPFPKIFAFFAPVWFDGKFGFVLRAYLRDSSVTTETD
jgi:hypothetical protein